MTLLKMPLRVSLTARRNQKESAELAALALPALPPGSR
jgi:hypothetical protein